MSEKPNQTKRGNKTGSTVRNRPRVDWQAPQCPHCQAVTNPTNLRYKRELHGDGEFAGRPYNKVTLWSADCGACGGQLTVRRHQFLPTKES
jgi:hypothetical protein